MPLSDACINVCPVEGQLEPYRLVDPARCLVNIESDLVQDKLGWCLMGCVTKCPLGNSETGACQNA